MEKRAILHSLLLLLFLPATLSQGKTVDLDVLVVRRVGHIPSEGLYSCITSKVGEEPDPSLEYLSAYIHDLSGEQFVCKGELSPQVAEDESIIYCLPPCPGVEGLYLDTLTVFVEGIDAASGDVVALGTVDSFTFKGVFPVVTQAGEGVVVAQWSAVLDRQYQTQLLHYPAALKEGEEADGGDDDHVDDGDDESYDGIDNDSEDNYNDEDDDKEKQMIWFPNPRMTSAPEIPFPAVLRASTAPNASRRQERSSGVLEISGPVRCPRDMCQYHFTSVPLAGSVIVEVMDVTESVVHSSLLPPVTLQAWGELTMDTVLLATEELEEDPTERLKTMTVTVVGETQDGDDFQAVLINGHDPSQALRSLPGECDPLGEACMVRGVETLTDPKGGGPVSDLTLLVSNHGIVTSSLVSITDVLVRVEWRGPGSVQVMWDRAPSVSEFSVRVVHEDGTPSDLVNVTCGSRGTDCLAVFSELYNGKYQAEVSYQNQVKVILSTHFAVEDGLILCDPPYTAIGDKCIMVETIAKGSWNEMANLCRQLGGELLAVNTDNLHHALVKFIIDEGLSLHSYWIGATDEEVENVYKWMDGSAVKRGTPFWGYNASGQQPDGGDVENCLLLDMDSFFFFTDAGCTEPNAAICEETL